MVLSGRHTGWNFNADSARLELYYRGTKIGHFTATTFNPQVAMAVTGALSSSSTVTGATGLIATTGDIKGTTGNVRLGVLSTFATTEPTSAVIMKVGTAPVGAITTSSGIFSDGTAVMKIVAGGTANNVET